MVIDDKHLSAFIHTEEFEQFAISARHFDITVIIGYSHVNYTTVTIRDNCDTIIQHFECPSPVNYRRHNELLAFSYANIFSMFESFKVFQAATKFYECLAWTNKRYCNLPLSDYLTYLELETIYGTTSYPALVCAEQCFEPKSPPPPPKTIGDMVIEQVEKFTKKSSDKMVEETDKEKVKEEIEINIVKADDMLIEAEDEGQNTDLKIDAEEHIKKLISDMTAKLLNFSEFSEVGKVLYDDMIIEPEEKVEEQSAEMMANELPIIVVDETEELKESVESKFAEEEVTSAEDSTTLEDDYVLIYSASFEN
jgi:hypothetical protein